MRILPAALAVILGAALLAACGGGGDNEDSGDGAPAAAAPAASDISATGTPDEGSATPGTVEEASATPGAVEEGSATPGPNGTSVQAVGCDFPSDIESFRFEMTMKAHLPSTPEAQATEPTEDTLGDFLGALSGLMGDMKMEGAVIAPDRSSMEMTIGGHEFASFVQVGSRSWRKVAGLTDWTEDTSSDGSDFLFSPLDFCETTGDDISAALSPLEGEKQTVNGIETMHYHLDKADLTLLQDFLGETQGLGELPEAFVMDVWLAEDGDWPVRMSFKASGKDDQGQDLSFEIFIEFKDFNDKGIEIEPPT
jgi:hypothetical protein